MAKQHLSPTKSSQRRTPGLLLLLPTISPTQSLPIGFAQIEMNLATFLFLGFLLLLGLVQFFAFRHRFISTKNELKDLASDLKDTREHLTVSKHEQKEAIQTLQATRKRFSGILTDAEIGIFQMDANGDCTEINTALNKMSGLYPKKVIKEGFHCAIHPDDQSRFKEAWEAFPREGASLELNFRFCPPRKKETHVSFCANKILNNKKEIEGYIGWVTDVSAQQEQQQQQKILTARYEQFIDETTESHYQLTPAAPIPLSDDTQQTANAIMKQMVLSSCSTTFATLQGTTPEKLIGQPIAEMTGGCGPLKNSDSIHAFLDAGCKITDQKSTVEMAGGKRIILLESAIGLVKDNKLTGIWGSQRDITQQMREKTELKSQLKFTQQILNSLPADISVKDTRCRYLFISKRTADRCGVPQNEWIGKTLSEIMPGTPKDADKVSISTMKTKKLHRTAQRFETEKMSGWTETVQIPLMSKEGLVEGAIGLTIDITEHKKQEDEARKNRIQLEKQIEETKNELAESEEQHNKTTITLSETTQTLTETTEALDKAKTEQAEFEKQLNEHSQTERVLRHSEQELLNRRKELEDQLTNGKNELNTEINKRTKWEELLKIRENELQKIEKHTTELELQIKEQNVLRNQAEASLATNQSDMDRVKAELETFHKEQAAKVATTKKIHTEIEQKVVKLNNLLTDAHQQIDQMTKQHTTELEKNKSEQQVDSIRLAQTLSELDSLKREFNQRLEEETKAFKQELAQKQIREKRFHQHEKELEQRVRELENVLQIKVRKLEDQTKARKEIEEQRDRIQHDLELQDQHRQKMFEQQAEKLHIDMAEERLEEIRMHKELTTLKHKNEALEEDLRTRDTELTESAKELEKLERDLTQSHKKNRQLTAELHLAIRNQ